MPMEPELTVAATGALLPLLSLINAEQLPAASGVTTIWNVVPMPLGLPKTTIALAPVPQFCAATMRPVVAIESVTVTVCA
jgi:hypothetical protein